MITVNNCTDTSDCEKVIVNDIVGSYHDEMYDLKVLNDKLIVTTMKNGLAITLTDMCGRKLISNNVRSNTVNTFDMSNLTNGLYVVNISGDETSVSRKIILTH